MARTCTIQKVELLSYKYLHLTRQTWSKQKQQDLVSCVKSPLVRPQRVTKPFLKSQHIYHDPMWDKYQCSKQMEPWQWAQNHTFFLKVVTTVYAVLWRDLAISIGTQSVQLQACKPVNKPLITCVCKGSLRNSPCLGTGSSTALELAGSWYVLCDASDGDRLVYKSLCPLGP